MLAPDPTPRSTDKAPSETRVLGHCLRAVAAESSATGYHGGSFGCCHDGTGGFGATVQETRTFS